MPISWHTAPEANVSSFFMSSTLCLYIFPTMKKNGYVLHSHVGLKVELHLWSCSPSLLCKLVHVSCVEENSILTWLTSQRENSSNAWLALLNHVKSLYQRSVAKNMIAWQTAASQKSASQYIHVRNFNREINERKLAKRLHNHDLALGSAAFNWTQAT